MVDIIAFEDVSMLEDIYNIEMEATDIYRTSYKYEHMYLKTGYSDILFEGFMDVISKMGEYFKKMIEAIKKFFRKIMMFIDSYLTDVVTFAKKYESQLRSLNVSFEVQGYEFTVGSEPNMAPFQAVVDGYNSQLSSMATLKKEEIEQMRNNFLTEDNKDNIRKEIAGFRIEDGDKLVEEIRKNYRNNEESPVKITVNSSYISKLVSEISTYDADKRKAIKLRDDLILLFSKAESFFDKKATTYLTGDNKQIKAYSVDIADNKFSKSSSVEDSFNESLYKNYNNFFKFKYEQTKFIGSVTNTVASERVNAYKDQLTQCRDILRKALTHKETKGESK